MPPLRDRPDDLPRLVDRLLDRIARPTPTLAEDVLPVLRAYRWPGNVRELSDALMSAVEAADGERVTRDHLPRFVREAHLLASNPLPPVKDVKLAAVLEEIERRLIRRAITQVNGNLTKAADGLGLDRPKLYRRMKALGITLPPAGSSPS